MTPGEGALGQFSQGMCRWPFRIPTPLYSLLYGQLLLDKINVILATPTLNLMGTEFMIH